MRRSSCLQPLLLLALFAQPFLVGSAFAQTTTAPSAGSAASEPVATFTGTASIGNQPAPAGTTVTVVTARSATDVTVCGTGTVGQQGSFSVAIQPLAGTCVLQTSNSGSGSLTYLFLINGEKVGSQSLSASLDQPTSLGRTYSESLRATAIPAVTTPSASSSSLLVVRFYGSLTASSGSPAPVGATVSVVATPAGGQSITCGTGATTDVQGDWAVDVPASSGCAPSTSSGATPPTTFIFYVDGQQLGAQSLSVALDQPATLALVYQESLRLTQPVPTSTTQPQPSPTTSTTQPQPSPTTSTTQPGSAPTPARPAPAPTPSAPAPSQPRTAPAPTQATAVATGTSSAHPATPPQPTTVATPQPSPTPTSTSPSTPPTTTSQGGTSSQTVASLLRVLTQTLQALTQLVSHLMPGAQG